MLKFISWNVNGLRACYDKGFVDVFHRLEADFFLTSSSCHPKFFIKEFGDFLMPCHQHGLGVNLLVHR